MRAICDDLLDRRSLFAWVLLLLTAAPACSSGQLPSTYDTGTENRPDCSDPTLANSPECSSRLPIRTQGQTGIDLNSTTPQVPSSYRDDEGFTRQSRSLSSGQPLPPEPYTEFQKFVAAATGRVLPIFGSDLFRRVPSTFAPVDLAPVPASYVVGPGDELRIRVWGQLTFQA